MPDPPPVPARRPPKVRSARSLVLSGLGGVLAGVVIFIVVLAIAGPKSAEQARMATFKVGSAERLAGTVARGGPLLFQDLLGGSRDIFVQHLGGEDWRAFEARPPGAPRECVLAWQPAERLFRDSCSPQTFPADGTGLTAFRTYIEEGTLFVDLTSSAG